MLTQTRFQKLISSGLLPEEMPADTRVIVCRDKSTKELYSKVAFVLLNSKVTGEKGFSVYYVPTSLAKDAILHYNIAGSNIVELNDKTDGVSLEFPLWRKDSYMFVSFDSANRDFSVTASRMAPYMEDQHAKELASRRAFGKMLEIAENE